MSERDVVVEARNLIKLFPVKSGIVRSVARKSTTIPIKETKGKTTYKTLKGDFVHAVDGVSFKIYKGETFGLVGESGCGKSTTGLLLLQLLDRTGGGIFFKDVETSEYTRAHLWMNTIINFSKFLIGRSSWNDVRKTFQHYSSQVRLFRKNIQIIFQNPYESLSPRFNVLDTVAEPLRLMHIVEDERKIEELVINELEEVGLIPGTEFLDRYPHELSGGQRQRVGVARAFILDPEFVVADEPVSMLDVSIRVGVLKIMQALTRSRGTGFLFITHDLALARHMCDRIAVMYLGRIVEQGPTEELIHRPLHPYTKALIKAVPKADPDARRTEDLPIKGEVPSGINIPPGCRFQSRCPYSTEKCKEIDPKLELVKTDHLVACIRVKEINDLK